MIGWREWIALPELGIDRIKAKIDTGARSSSLHAFDVREHTTPAGVRMVRFVIHPVQRDTGVTVEAEAPLLARRTVRSSNGQTELRPVIRTTLRLLGRAWPIELNLTNRDAMGFRLLLGRQAVRRRLLVDAGASFVGERKRPPDPDAPAPS